MMNVLTIDNANEYYRIHSESFDFGDDETTRRAEEIRQDAKRNGLVFTACDWNLKLVALKKIVRAC